MKPDALLQFKTDNQGLFEYSLVSMNHFGMTFDLVSLNLHHDKRVTDNVPTEYEEKFSADGGRISGAGLQSETAGDLGAGGGQSRTQNMEQGRRQ